MLTEKSGAFLWWLDNQTVVWIPHYICSRLVLCFSFRNSHTYKIQLWNKQTQPGPCRKASGKGKLPSPKDWRRVLMLERWERVPDQWWGWHASTHALAACCSSHRWQAVWPRTSHLLLRASFLQACDAALDTHLTGVVPSDLLGCEMEVNISTCFSPSSVWSYSKFIIDLSGRRQTNCRPIYCVQATECPCVPHWAVHCVALGWAASRQGSLASPAFLASWSPRWAPGSSSDLE